ncbi:hypothetical protein Baya_17168 [Bagarius yarrelli]|uniref:Uncharacterized protein n=1 Tax=Bagarius yarrelli TaxID=175774 RepID=A0A556VXN3_BAGYA|nr:hypothetical protein Baya_17168 [Bagarius yarrelli]
MPSCVQRFIPYRQVCSATPGGGGYGPEDEEVRRRGSSLPQSAPGNPGLLERECVEYRRAQEAYDQMIIIFTS